LFKIREDRETIFRNDTYLFGARGMYLNPWSIDFDLAEDIPTTIPVWEKLLRLPLSCWADHFLRVIGNVVGRYIDREEPKGGKLACTKICMQVDLEKSILIEILRTMGK